MENFLTRAVLRPLIARPCLNCGLPPRPPWFLLCPSCAGDAAFIEPSKRCPRCLNVRDASGYCGDCGGREIFWDECGAFLDYRAYIGKELFTRYKFEASLAAEKDLSTLLTSKLEPLKGSTVLLAPCGKATEAALGFHPTERLLKGFGIKTVRPFTKIGRAAQKDLSAEERRKRKDFLALARGFTPPKTVLLVDDVMTTGSTLNEGARLLKERGAEEVRILALFRD